MTLPASRGAKKREDKERFYYQLLEVNNWTKEDYILENLDKIERRVRDIRDWVKGTNPSCGIDIKWLIEEARIVADLYKLWESL